VGAVAVALSGMGGLSAQGALFDNLWTGTTSTDWNDPTNWSLGRVPVKGGTDQDNALINTTSPRIATISADLAATPNDITLGNGVGSVGQVNHTAGSASTGGGNWLIIGQAGGSGTYNLANTAGSGGTFTGMGLGSGSMTAQGRLYLSGQGGVTNTATTGLLNVRTTGTLTVGNDFSIGAARGTGTMNLDAGTVNIGGWLSIGRDEASNGQPTSGGVGNWNQSGGSVNVTNAGAHLVVALPGTTGNFNLTGGTVASAGEVWFGQGTGGTATANVSGGSVTATNWIAVGRAGGVGTMTISNGGTVAKTGNSGTHIVIGSAGGNGTGVVNVQPGGTLSSDTDIWLGEGARGTVNQSGGLVKALGSLFVRRDTNGVGIYNLTAGVLSVDGAINQNGGTFSFTGGRITRSNAGVITYTGDLTFGNSSAGFKLDNDKTFAVSGVLNVAAGNTFDLTGRTIPAGGGPGSFPLGTDGSIIGTFGPGLTNVLGLNNAAGATFISETQGESAAFNPATQSVFWIQEQGGAVTLKYSVVPEPGAVGMMMLAGIGFLARRRRGAE
jgi:T5SS/PEP-CTERM-associated repeat protein